MGELLEQASARIRAAFSAGRLPEETAAAMEAEYRRLDAHNGGVAVRSSATTEDLPDLSFAGQQDTFLNVTGAAQLRQAVVDCWSSLWTARAIGYRIRNGIPHEQAALAVVVQRMVASEVAGVLFTANPLSGLLNEMVIDATFGLGEALVSGQVEPDHYVVDSLSGAIRSVTLGAKGTATRTRAGGGVENVSQAGGRPADPVGGTSPAAGGGWQCHPAGVRNAPGHRMGLCRRRTLHLAGAADHVFVPPAAGLVRPADRVVLVRGLPGGARADDTARAGVDPTGGAGGGRKARSEGHL